MFITNVPGEDLPVSVLMARWVRNSTGETIGKVHELIIDQKGHITTMLLDVGNFVGGEEKIVAIPFSALEIDATLARKPSLVIHLGKEELEQAPKFEWTAISHLDRLKDQGTALGQMAAAKASELIHKAAEKASDVGEMAVEKASELSLKASEKASEVGGKAREKATELSQMAAEKATEIGQKVVEKTSKLTRKIPESDDGN